LVNDNGSTNGWGLATAADADAAEEVLSMA
jgi:hypothetical protein